jgi:hypothetical protein
VRVWRVGGGLRWQALEHDALDGARRTADYLLTTCRMLDIEMRRISA